MNIHAKLRGRHEGSLEIGRKTGGWRELGVAPHVGQSDHSSARNRADPVRQQPETHRRCSNREKAQKQNTG